MRVESSETCRRSSLKISSRLDGCELPECAAHGGRVQWRELNVLECEVVMMSW